jgi:hypothetical protein
LQPIIDREVLGRTGERREEKEKGKITNNGIWFSNCYLAVTYKRSNVLELSSHMHKDNPNQSP